jgi:hypothetical protein
VSAAPPGAAGSSWADDLEATIDALRDVRTMIAELHGRAAVLSEAVDALVLRIVDAHAAEILTEAELRRERDPIDPALLAERLP